MEVIDILLMDKGNGAATEYEFNQDVADYIMDKIQGTDTIESDPSWMGIKIGHIHSHHSMDVFFSGTDMNELVINCNHHNLYLSLIVNNFMEMIAKLVYKGTPCAYITTDENGDAYEMGALGTERPLLFVHDCDIERSIQEELVSELFRKRTEEIIKKVKVTPTPQVYQNKGGTHQSWESVNNPQQKAFDKIVSQGGATYPAKKEEANVKPKEKEDMVTFPAINSLDEAFACYLIRFGEVFPNDDLEQALMVMQDEGVDGVKLITNIIPSLGKFYSKFMIINKEIEDISKIEMDDFLLSLETVNDLLSDYEAKYPFVIPLINEIDTFVKITENKWREYIFEGVTDVVIDNKV